MYRRKPGGNWYITVDGSRKSAKTTDRERAKRKEVTENAEAWDEEHGFTVRTWDRAVLKWQDDHPHLASRVRHLGWVEWWTQRISGRSLKALTPKVVNEIIMRERKGVSLTERTPQNATANAYVAFLGRVIRHVSRLRVTFTTYPPCLGNDRWSPVDEWLSISSHMNADELDIFTFLLATGQREANAMFYEWAWDHGTWGTVPASDTKTDVPYGFPYNKTAQAVIERRRQASIKHQRYAFSRGGRPWNRMALLRSLARACEAAGVEVMTVHAIRHTFGTWLARAGVPREIRMRLMGHSMASVHDRYIHYDVESLRGYAEIVDRIIAEGIAAKSSQAA